MNKCRQLRLELLEAIKQQNGYVRRNVVSKQPYTFVEITVYDELNQGENVVGQGFSKVCYPDIFDYSMGVDIATARAVYDAAEQMR